MNTRLEQYTMTYREPGADQDYTRNFWASSQEDAQEQAEAWLGYPTEAHPNQPSLISVERKNHTPYSFN